MQRKATADEMQVRPVFLTLLFASFVAASLAFAESPAPEPAPSPSPAAESTPAPVQPTKPVTFTLTHVESSKPQVVRICYLDEGTREIVLPPAVITNTLVTNQDGKQSAAVVKQDPDPSEPQIVRISNLDDGNHAIVVEP